MRSSRLWSRRSPVAEAAHSTSHTRRSRQTRAVSRLTVSRPRTFPPTRPSIKRPSKSPPQRQRKRRSSRRLPIPPPSLPCRQVRRSATWRRTRLLPVSKRQLPTSAVTAKARLSPRPTPALSRRSFRPASAPAAPLQRASPGRPPYTCHRPRAQRQLLRSGLPSRRRSWPSCARWPR